MAGPSNSAIPAASPDSAGIDELRAMHAAAQPPQAQDAVSDAAKQGKDKAARRRKGKRGSGDRPPADDRPIGFSDDALAQAFSNKYGDQLRFVASVGGWFVWDGERYRRDEKQRTFAYARKICRDQARACENVRVAAQISSAKTVWAVAKLASTDKCHAARFEEFDADPWVLNTPIGTVDLRSGRLIKHDPAAMMTKITRVGPHGECPIWHRYLSDVTAGDAELAGYLQRVAGYCLTGSINEHAVFFAFGPGGNGKSVFANVLTEMMGEYAAVAPMEVFTVARGERHPTELAMLRGARLVTASETEEGKRWDEAKLKAITGGDPITARYMRGDFFTFTPNFKLYMLGNYKPSIRSVDEAMRRRLNILPFMQRIAQPDKSLPDKLRSELPGILAWAIKGCLDWQRRGLAPPAAVQTATTGYFLTEDALGRWIEERLEVDPDATTLTRELFRDWKIWAEGAGEYIGSERRLSQMIEQRGYVRWQHPISRSRGFRGLRLLSSQSDMGFPNRYGDGSGADGLEHTTGGK